MEEPEIKRAKFISEFTSPDEQAYRDSNLVHSAVDKNLTLTERDVGIEYFMNTHCPGFDCILKNRWEDFLVQEVSHGELAKLTNLDSIVPQNSVELSGQLSCEANQTLEAYKDDLNELITGKRDCVKLPAPESKVDRTYIHKALRSFYPKLSSSTIKEDIDSSNIILVVRTDNSSVRLPKRANNSLPKGKRFCRFVLYKEGKDTISAIRLLSSYLRVNAGFFAYAGTKDKRAITSQFVTVKDVDSERLAALNSRLQGLKVGNFSYVANPLFLGDLDGNKFTVVLRSVSSTESIISKAVTSWISTGFINYYGLQRFGHSAKSRSFEIGKHLLRGEWAEAIDLILIPTDADLPLIRQTKEAFLSSNDVNTCVANIPPSVEKSLLHGIAKHGKTLNALQNLPRNLRQLYVHSYQSLMWNKIASRRIELSRAPHALPGDLYIPNAVASLPVEDTEVPETEDSSNMVKPPTSPTVQVATSENCRNIPLTDVVLPLPGFSVSYPQNECGQWYEELLNEDKLSTQRLRHSVKDFALPGSYRALVVKPTNVTYQLRYYTDPKVPLVESDLQLLEAHKNSGACALVNPSPEDSTTTSQQALVLEFFLPKSSYATMAIRELTKSVVERR